MTQPAQESSPSARRQSGLTVDEALLAARQLGLRHVADEQNPNLWHATCPLCVLATEGKHLAISCSEPAPGKSRGAQSARIDCSKGCERGFIMHKFEAVLARVSTSEHDGGGLAVRDADLSRSKPPEWAWQNRIALGAINLIVGVEGAGKGTLAAWMFARISRGELPGDLYGMPATVAVIGDEDSWQDVWTPRLHVAGADIPARVKLIERGDGSLIELAADRERLAAKLLELDVRLLYLDQLTDNLGAAVDDWRGKQVREALAPARLLARELGIAVLGSLHPNKSGGSFRQVTSGSMAFNAVSRSSLYLAVHPDDPDRRVVVRGKGNLSGQPEAVEFAIKGRQFEAYGHVFDVPQAVDFATSSLTSEDLLAAQTPPAPAGGARTDGRELVASLLSDGRWHKAAEIIADCEEAGIQKHSTQRAARDLGIEKTKRGYPAKSWWRLRGQEVSRGTSVAAVASVTSVDMALESRGDSENRDDSQHECHPGVTTAGARS